MQSSRLEIALAVLLLAAACRVPANDQPQEQHAVNSRPSPWVELADGTRIEVEVSSTEETRATGLMHRSSVPAGKGMLFLFPRTEVHAFWMKDTLVPLDIIWIDDQWRVVHIERGVPPCPGDPCPSYTPSAASRYVLEIGGGEATRLRLRVGDQLKAGGYEGYEVR